MTPAPAPTTTPALRPATPDDAPALARVLGDWVREAGWMPVLHDRGEDLGFLRRLIATCEVTTLGDAAGFLAREGEEVRALYLAPAARGRGARRFYAREGFRVVGRTDGTGNEEKLPDVRLEWEAP